MPKIVIDLDGWRKVVEATELAIRSGVVRAVISPPLSNFRCSNDQVTANAITWNFFRTGEYTGGPDSMLIFKADLPKF